MAGLYGRRDTVQSSASSQLTAPPITGLVAGDRHPSSNGRLMTAEEVAELIGMRVDWVYAQSRKGLIPTVKLGRYRRYRREAIERWICEQER